MLELEAEVIRLKRVIDGLRDELAFSATELIRRQHSLKIRLAAAEVAGANSSWKAEDEERMFRAVEQLEDMLVGFEEHKETLASSLHEIDIVMANAHKVANLEKKKSSNATTQTEGAPSDRRSSFDHDEGSGSVGMKRMAKAVKRVRTIVKLMPKVSRHF